MRKTGKYVEKAKNGKREMCSPRKVSQQEGC